MKKLILFLLSILIISLVTGCAETPSNNTNPDDTNDPVANQTEPDDPQEY